MLRDEYRSAREARTALLEAGYAPTVPGDCEGAICWVKSGEPGYYLVARTVEGARLYHYWGKPELPPGAIVTHD